MAHEKCSHCRQSFDENALMIDEIGNKFCCNGCKQVFYLLKENGLDDFYNRLGKNTLNAAKIREFSANETQGIYDNFVRKTADGFNEIFIIIDGIHCTACVWLNEKVLFNTAGIVEASINATTNKAKIVWDETQTSLAEIFNKIQAIGYNPYPYDPKTAETRINSQRREFYAKLLVGIFCVMNIMWIAVALYSGYFSGIDAKIKDILHFAEFVLATPVLFYTGSAFYKGAYFAIKNRSANMDLLISTGVTIVYIYSLYAMFARSGEVYFDSVAMIITFVFIGKYLEILSKKQAVDNLDSLSNMVTGAVMVKVGDEFVSKNPNEVALGDEILINSGQKVLIDGDIISGSASFDYASLNGESIPVSKEKGDFITSGAVCIDGSIRYKASANFSSSVLSKIINLLENASLKKPKIELLVNQISAKFSITILSIAFFTFLFWFFNANLQTAIIIAVSVIIIACPCALGLATPVGTLVGLSSGLKKGIIFKEAKIIETIAKCDCVVFDKTGTLTSGNLQVGEFEILEEFDKNLLFALLKSSNHPVSVAVAKFISENFKDELKDEVVIKSVENIAAKGIKAKFKNLQILGGNSKFMQENGIKCQSLGATEYFFAVGGEIKAKFSLNDEIRKDAPSVVAKLKNLGLEIYILSGDNEEAVRSVAQNLGIKNYKFSLLPDEKSEFINSLNSQGKSVIMVGDGVNDAAALLSAAVGIALGSGADISIAKSDVVLMRNDLQSLLGAVLIAKQTFKTIKQNLAFSLVYNALTIPLAVCGFIIPLFAALSMSLSSVLVVLNSMRIKKVLKKD